MKQLTDIELKKASILDLTDDIELIKKVLEDEYFEKDEVKSWNEDGKMISLFSYAQYTNNTDLLKRLEVLFEKERAALFNE